MIVSDKVIAQMRASELTGWGSVPCSLEADGKSWLFHFIVVWGRCGEVAYSEGEIVERVDGFEKRRGLHFVKPAATSDLFLSQSDYRQVFMTSRAKNAFDAGGVDNVHWVPLADVEYFTPI